ncbi:hypothetical protein HPB49_012817 [Dermacentor silvarum]|uniref:Uncharacterized protein n=1 Tax=Dermacentor silvarum TaxID=543639 RepID=A0ACB8C9J1_DERSI|nr:hypothetical protein HPB49_012817 [Dermacentor silvarum]
MWRVRKLLVFAASATAAFGAIALAMLIIRKLGISLTSDVLLVDPNAWYTVRLERRIPITPNVRLLRFSLRNRYQAGGFDIMVKVYHTGVSEKFPEVGLMSQFLDTVPLGAKLKIQGPRGRFVYEGQGRFVTVDGSRLPQATWLGLVAAGSGVTPMLQLLRHALVDETDETKIKMIDVNSTEEDIIARRELDHYAKVHAERFRYGADTRALGAYLDKINLNV